MSSALPPPRLLQQAANWYAELQDEPAASPRHGQWRQWLEQDQAHRRAWEHIESLAQRLEPLRGDGLPGSVGKALRALQRGRS